MIVNKIKKCARLAVDIRLTALIAMPVLGAYFNCIPMGKEWNSTTDRPLIYDYLLNPLRPEVHIKPTPEHATVVYLLMYSRASPRSGYVVSFLAPLFFSRFLSVFLSPVFHLVSI